MFEWNPPKPPRKPRPEYRPMRLLSDRPWGARGTSRRKLHPKNWKLHGVPHRFWPRILPDGHKLLPEGRGHSHKRECFWCRRVFYTEIDIREASSRFCCTSCQRYFANYAERHRKRVWLKDLATRRALEVAAWRQRVRDYKAQRLQMVHQLAENTDLPLEWLLQIEKRGFAAVTKELLDMADKARLVTETRYHIEHTIATELPKLVKLAAASLDPNNADTQPLTTAQVTLLRMLLDKVVPNASSATMNNSAALLEIDVDTMSADQLEQLAEQTRMPIIDHGKEDDDFD